MNLQNYPELTDCIQDAFFEGGNRYTGMKQIIELLSEMVQEPGLNISDIIGLIQECEHKFEQLENEEEERPSLEFITLQCKSISETLNK